MFLGKLAEELEAAFIYLLWGNDACIFMDGTKETMQTL